MSILNQIYNISPVQIQNLMISSYGLYWKKRRFGGVFTNELRAVKERESFTKEQWYDFQEEKLRDLLVHAFINVEYYNAAFKKCGLDISKLQKFSLDKINVLPILDKDTLRKECRGRLISSKKEKFGTFFESSGSTGTPTSILYSFKMHQKWSAIFEARVRNWAGVSMNDPRAMIGGRRIILESGSKGPFYRYNFAEKQLYLSAYHINKANAKDYLFGIKNHNVQYMNGYASANYFLAKNILELNLDAPELKAVITSSEKLTKKMRDVFHRVYNCRTYDGYGAVEACVNITECEFGSMHISPDAGIVEIINDDGNKCKPGEEGRIICTGLLNFDQPLIRYEIGDIIKLSTNQSCNCSREMPIVDSIVGRLEDTVRTQDGKEMVRFHSIFYNLDVIIESQIVQKKYNFFIINLVASRSLYIDEKKKIIDRMESQLGKVEIEFRYLDVIPKNKNGKYRTIISEIE